MERRYRREANRAHRQERRAERKEERLHFKAVNAAMHGNIGRAVRLEQRSNIQHHKAEEAHRREMNSRHTANVIHHSRHSPVPPPCPQVAPRPPQVVHVYHPAPPHAYPAPPHAYPAPPHAYPPRSSPPPPYPVGTCPPPPPLNTCGNGYYPH